MSGIGRDKGMCIDCEAMEAESEARGRGVCAMVLSTCQVVGAEAITWSETAESKAKASLHLTAGLCHMLRFVNGNFNMPCPAFGLGMRAACESI